MSESMKISGLDGASRAAGGPQSTGTATQGGYAFQALLDKLRSDAQLLEDQSERNLDPKELAGAVDRAHASLQDALSLSEQILEALRAGDLRQRSTGGSSNPHNP